MRWMRFVLPLLAVLMLLPGVAAAQSGNPLHDALASADEPTRRAEMFRVVQAGGSGCQAIIVTYFAGLDSGRTAYWDARCREGTMYRLALPALRTGRPAVTTCGAAGGGIAAGPCFQPLGTQMAQTAQTTGGTGVQLASAAPPMPANSRFGAVYGTDAPLAAWGFGNGSTDRLAVNTAAVRACQTMAGRVPCKFLGEIVNQCGALVQAVTRHPNAVAITGDISTVVLNRNFTAAAATQAEAEAAAMEQCRRVSGVICRVTASGC